LNVIQWLRDDKLRNPYRLQSAYALLDKKKATPPREAIQFTNVTSGFVGLLDYVFFEPSKFDQTAHLYVPTSLKSMNHTGVTGGHLIPSNTWPSDHLAVGARLAFKMKKKKKNALPNSGIPIVHPIKCGCGCVPNVLSLFEMAELRKRAREAARAS
jgi:mRNA deadenylase 3'-5' endonuclease subunit Ccr4